ncbi:MAG: ABC transporter ATP-binding protein [Candidatus Heimdallarchaeaceae archaeon]
MNEEEISAKLDEISNDLIKSNHVKDDEFSPIVEVSNVTKTFGSVIAVNNVSFTVKPGEIFGLLGPNGAGKTTCVKLILGLLEADNGEIKVFGLDPLKDELEVKRKVGYVSEEPLIYKSMTPRMLFNFISSLRNLDPTEATRRLQYYLQSFEALEYYNKLIANDPELLIMDEPLTGLDAKSAKLVKEILELHKEKGGSVIFSTHILEIAEEMCDRIGIINKGKLIAIGTVEELSKIANKVGADLEDIFLRLTQQDESVEEIISNLKQFMNNNK